MWTQDRKNQHWKATNNQQKYQSAFYKFERSTSYLHLANTIKIVDKTTLNYILTII